LPGFDRAAEFHRNLGVVVAPGVGAPRFMISSRLAQSGEHFRALTVRDSAALARLGDLEHLAA
jgi:hypothetical protein